MLFDMHGAALKEMVPKSVRDVQLPGRRVIVTCSLASFCL